MILMECLCFQRALCKEMYSSAGMLLLQLIRYPLRVLTFPTRLIERITTVITVWNALSILISKYRNVL